MTRYSRSNDWGFPRWRGYGSERGATQVRLCALSFLDNFLARRAT